MKLLLLNCFSILVTISECFPPLHTSFREEESSVLLDRRKMERSVLDEERNLRSHQRDSSAIVFRDPDHWNRSPLRDRPSRSPPFVTPNRRLGLDQQRPTEEPLIRPPLRDFARSEPVNFNISSQHFDSQKEIELERDEKIRKMCFLADQMSRKVSRADPGGQEDTETFTSNPKRQTNRKLHRPEVQTQPTVVDNTRRNPNRQNSSYTTAPYNTASPNYQESRQKGSGEIIFPDRPSFKPIMALDFTPRIDVIKPSCANGSTFCVELMGDVKYPDEYLKEVLQKEAAVFKELFGNDELEDVNIVHRIDAVDENPLCQSVEEVVYPKMAQNKDDKWLFVINQDQFIQGVRVETCRNEGEACRMTSSFPLGYRTQCKQKYIYRRLLALSEGGQTMSDSFRLPSCCTCHLLRDPSTRHGLIAPAKMSSAFTSRRTKPLKSKA